MEFNLIILQMKELRKEDEELSKKEKVRLLLAIFQCLVHMVHNIVF